MLIEISSRVLQRWHEVRQLRSSLVERLPRFKARIPCSPPQLERCMRNDSLFDGMPASLRPPDLFFHLHVAHLFTFSVRFCIFLLVAEPVEQPLR